MVNIHKRAGRKKSQIHPVDGVWSCISDLCAPLLELCEFAVKHHSDKKPGYRPLLRSLRIESTTVEERIDNYGAQKNEIWYPLRESVAAIKLFSTVCYNIMHIQDALPRYKLIEVAGNFYDDTHTAIDSLTDAVTAAAKTLTYQAKRCNLRRAGAESSPIVFPPEPPTIRLPVDRKVRHVKETGAAVVYLSTAFLNLSKDRDVASVLRKRETEDYSTCIPDSVNEENLRIAEARFHNLQSHYDTYIFESDIENQNRNLPVLRGHISVIYHLLGAATDLAHYYERHMSELRRRMIGEYRFPLSKPVLLQIIFEYLLEYAREYMEAATNLCRSMIHSYSEKREIEVPIPNYRGFHVRPSALMAKVVAHYGSSVTMVLNGREYNAGVTFDLFRANEEINAVKRREIGRILEQIIDPQQPFEYDAEELVKKLQILFLELANDQKIILYDTGLLFNEFEPEVDETMINYVCRYIRHYMSIGKIDVQSTMTATLKGDNRALLDLKLLAESGYGEDRYGNNIVLPQELVYLRR